MSLPYWQSLKYTVTNNAVELHLRRMGDIAMDETATREKSAVGVTFAIISAILFGTLVPFSKMLLQGFTPIQFAAFLLLGGGIGAGCLLVARTALAKGSTATGISWDDAPKLALMVVLNAVAVVCLACGITYALAANASLLMGFEIAAATICGWAFFHRHVCFKAIAAVGLICIAAVLLCWNVTDEAVFVPQSLFIVAACVLRGFESGLKRSLADRDPVQLAFVRSLGAGIALLVAALVAGGLPTAPASASFGVVLLGVATFGFGAVMHLSAERRLGSARSEQIFSLAPFVGMLISWSCFGFGLEPLFFGSLALMALGVWLAMDDSVFHEDAFAALDRERFELYSGGESPFDFDLMHQPLQH